MQSLCRYNHSIFVNCTILHTHNLQFFHHFFFSLVGCSVVCFLLVLCFFQVFRFDIIFNVTSFVLLFSRTQPLHFETVWLLRNWEIYDLWKRYLYVNRNNDNYVIYKCYTNKLLRCSWRVTAWLCIREDFPSCCLQVYLIRGVCHISHFSLFCIYKSFDCIKYKQKSSSSLSGCKYPLVYCVRHITQLGKNILPTAVILLFLL